MKGCLKLSSTPSPGHDSQGHHHNEHPGAHALTPASSPTTASSSSTADAATTTPTQPHSQTHRKCVAFCKEGTETVYPADEWDRTPAEPARKLSYQCVCFSSAFPMPIFGLVSIGCISYSLGCLLALCCFFLLNRFLLITSFVGLDPLRWFIGGWISFFFVHLVLVSRFSSVC